MELDALDIAAFLVIVLALAGTVAIILTLGALPYQVARSRSHPHADAIRVAGWLGLFLGGLPWLLVLLWSLLPPHGAAAPA